MLGIPLGLLMSNAGEYFIHKHLLHGRGSNRTSFWAFHWHDHHRACRTQQMVDQQYSRPLFSWSPQGKEALSLIVGALLLAPLVMAAPFFTITVWWRMWRYYQIHKRAHLDVDWAKQHLPWHYEHHMGKNQNANWCVTHPFFDHLMGTRLGLDGQPHVSTGWWRRLTAGLREASTVRRVARQHG